MDKVFYGIHGSHLYGLNTENSDIDYKGIFIPTVDEIILGSPSNIRNSTGPTHEKNSKDDVDEVYFTLKKFVELACQGQTVAIDMLHTPDDKIQHTSDVWKYLVKNRTKFYSKNMNSFMGYLKKQASKYGIKGSRVRELEELLNIIDDIQTVFSLESETLADIRTHIKDTEHFKWETTTTDVNGEQNFYVVCGSMMHDKITVKEFRQRVQQKFDQFGARAKLARDNDGIDWKAVSHALRAGYQLRDIYKYGDFEYPLKETWYILETKLGQRDFLTDVALELESLVAELEDLCQNSTLSDEVDKAFWDNFIIDVYSNKIIVELI